MAGLPPLSRPVPFEVPCVDCLWHKVRRCSGPATKGSVLPSPGLLACQQTDRLRTLVANVDGFRGSYGSVGFQEVAGLPLVVPTLARFPAAGSEIDPRYLYTVNLGDIIDHTGRLLFPTGEELRAVVGLPPTGRLGLLGAARDDRLEAFWARCRQSLALPTIAGYRLEFATSATFSVFAEGSRSGQLLSSERNRVVAEVLAAHGVPVIPSFLETEPEDVEFLGRWLRRHPSLAAVAVWADGWRRPAEFEALLDRCSRLRDVAGRGLHFLVAGCFALRRLQRARARLVTVSFASKKLAMKAVGGQCWDGRVGGWVDRRDLPRKNVFRLSVEAYLNAANRLASDLEAA